MNVPLSVDFLVAGRRVTDLAEDDDYTCGGEGIYAEKDQVGVGGDGLDRRPWVWIVPGRFAARRECGFCGFCQDCKRHERLLVQYCFAWGKGEES